MVARGTLPRRVLTGARPVRRAKLERLQRNHAGGDDARDDSDADRAFRARWYVSRTLVYGALVLWAVICLFPIFWTVTTSFKIAPDVMKGHLIPWIDFDPQWRGWRSLGLDFLSESGHSEFLVVYGGLEIGLGLFFFRCSRTAEWTRPGSASARRAASSSS